MIDFWNFVLGTGVTLAKMQNSTKSSEKKNTKTVHSVAKLVVIGFSDVLELDHRFLRQLSRILYVIVRLVNCYFHLFAFRRVSRYFNTLKNHYSFAVPLL